MVACSVVKVRLSLVYMQISGQTTGFSERWMGLRSWDYACVSTDNTGGLVVSLGIDTMLESMTQPRKIRYNGII